METVTVGGRMHPSERLMVALDYPDHDSALIVARSLVGVCKWMKVGLELYTSSGPRIIEGLRELGFSIFIDLKLLEIPNSVSGAVQAAARVGASMVTIHASGGPRMIEAAVSAAASYKLQILAVTVPTSMGKEDLTAVGISREPLDQVILLAKLATSIGVGGIVCSPNESAAVRNEILDSILLVVPGIRPKLYQADDQTRISTATEAIRSGADHLVVGRPITRHSNPKQMALQFQIEIAQAEAMHHMGWIVGSDPKPG
jgi:orotidine-5'-phosphate decarboxylase